MSTFDRTALFCKEETKYGKRIRRIPWDFVAGGVSPAPVDVEGLSNRVSDTVFRISDFIGEESLGDLECQSHITDIVYYESEEHLYGLHDGTFGFYKTDSDQSAEFGYPRT